MRIQPNVSASLILAAALAPACGDNIHPASDGALATDGRAADARTDALTGDALLDARHDGATACVDNTTACAGDDLVVCGTGGVPVSTTTCALGCAGSGGATACNVLTPSNIAATTCDTAGSADLTVASGTMALSTTTGCDAIVTQTNAPAICVRKFATVSIAAGATLRVTGTRALALVATTSMTVDGEIDASANAGSGGPGAPLAAGVGTSGGQGGLDDSSISGGGAGGSTTGAAGSTTTTAGAGGAGGAVTGTETLVPLVAGAAGGANGAGIAILRLAAGGAGGGGVQLVSCGALAITDNAIIDAGGGGGAGGPGTNTLTAPGGGGGGGGGGAILLEAASITIVGTVAANGGGGGGGGVKGADVLTTGAPGLPGADGAASATAAAGGDGPAEAGAGGAGGAAGAVPKDGAPPTATTGGAGGGGGAAGRIRINVRAGTTPTVTGITSPAPSVGVVAVH